MKTPFSAPTKSAYQAISEAQRIAFAPVVFQAVRALRDLNILQALDDAASDGITVNEIAAEIGLSPYGVGVLVESGLSAGVVDSEDGRRFKLSKVGFFLLHDRMTRINMDFNHLVCYRGLYSLAESVEEGQPEGLATIDTEHNTFYEALPTLPKDVRASWYAFDHFYSDSAYPKALDEILSHRPTSIVDIGANQGRFSILAAQTDDSLQITMIDLPDQLAEAVTQVEQAGLDNRIDAVAMDVREESARFPESRSVYWLSQFICCFGDAEIIEILRRIGASMTTDSRLYILETCWDQQQYEAAAFSLINTSPYFTCIANGNSKMYASGEILKHIDLAGLDCVKMTPKVGSFHTLFECMRP